jgi:hypothetical protein
MPWTVADVDKHRKGLTPEQKKKWVAVANGIYKDCLAKGGTDKTCAPKAIKIANSKFSEESIMKKETLKLNRSALSFTDHDSFSKIAPATEGKPRTLKMVAYSGKIIKNHWYWGDLAIDTSGLKMAKKEIPILNDHMTEEKIGFGAFIVDDKHAIVLGDMTFVDTPFASEFIKLSDQGFPYEASIYARPSKIQRLTEDEETEVNGFKMKGPGTVWRESVLKEGSVVTFGADANTKSVAMAEDEEMELEVTQLKQKQEEEVIMDLAKLKAEFLSLYEEVVALGKQEAEAAFAVVKTGLETTITQLTADKTQLSNDNKDISARLLKVEKESATRRETELRLSADSIFSAKLAAASIPERLHAKVKKQIDYGKFVKDDKLDIPAFSAAIDTELKDWAPVEGEEQSVLGMGYSRPADSSVDSDVMVDRMLKSVGQEKTATH